jgi:hypothetical protein
VFLKVSLRSAFYSRISIEIGFGCHQSRIVKVKLLQGNEGETDKSSNKTKRGKKDFGA